MTDEKQQILSIYFQEYGKLKDEQAQRIGFRDNLLYVTLVVFTTVLAFALGEPGNAYALLALPWVSLVLGWTYLVNDQKITAIGQYLRYTLTENIAKLAGRSGADIGEIDSILGWEVAHRSDKRRMRRKIEQLIVDEIVFVISGIAAFIAFKVMVYPIHPLAQVLAWTELVLLVILAIEIFIGADLAKGR